MPLLRIASDLHLEGFYGRAEEVLANDFLPPDDRDASSVLILAGDISSVPDQLVRFIDACLKRFPHVIFVGGNHEFYRQHMERWCTEMDLRLGTLKAAHPQAHLHFVTSGVECVTIEGTRFILTTLWGDGGPTLADQAQVGFYLNDFRLIQTDDPPRRFSTTDMVKVFKRSKAEVQRLLETPFDGKTVVVTHHLPSRRLVSARFWPGDGSDGANGGFVGQCDDLLARTEIAPALWVHGHTHDTIDTTLWQTHIVCNPSGYRGEWATNHNTYRQVQDGQVTVVPVFVEV